MTTFFRVTTHNSVPIAAHDQQIIPRLRVVVIRLPRIRGSITWRFPASLVVQPSEGEEQALPVIDTTRLIQIGLFLATIIVFLLMRRRLFS